MNSFQITRHMLARMTSTAALVLVSAIAGLGATFTVTTTSDSGPGSLRQAIIDSNSTAGHDLIEFNIQGSGPFIIQPLSTYPALMDSVTIDGYSQPGSSENTLAVGSNAVIQITISGASGNGLTVSAGGTLIRGLSLINFGSAGIYIGAGENTVVEGNFIGIGSDGVTNEGNTIGIFIVYPSVATRIGGTEPSQRNVIAGNWYYNVYVSGNYDFESESNEIVGNLIGTDKTGTLGYGLETGVYAGIYLSGSSGSEIHANVISGIANGGGIFSDYAGNNTIKGNKIGVSADGANAIGNGFGIAISDANAMSIGGNDVGDPNIIANSVYAGIVVTYASSGIDISSNAIYSNPIPIDLRFDGPTTNDPCDSDEGPNGLQNFPVIMQAISDNGQTEINGIFDSKPNAAYRLEFFSSDAVTTSGQGEGKQFIGSQQVNTSAGCGSNFSVTFPIDLPSTDYVSATATDATGNTSEFSIARPVNAPPLLPVDLAISMTVTPPIAVIYTDITLTLDISNVGSTDATTVQAVVNIPFYASYESGSPGCSFDGIAVTCDVGSLAAGVSTTRTIVFKPYDTGQFLITSLVRSAEPDLATANNVSEQTVLFGFSPFLILTPVISSGNAGGDHSIEAQVIFGGVGLSGIELNAQVTSGPNVGQSAVITTNSSGVAVFTYTSLPVTGVDTISIGGVTPFGNVSENATRRWNSIANGICYEGLPQTSPPATYTPLAIQVPDDLYIRNVTVTTDGFQSGSGALRVSIQSPSGRIVEQPFVSQGFNGENAAGEWKMYFSKASPGAATFNAWCISVEGVQPKVWDGGGSTNNWSEAANWSGDEVPAGTDTVIFNGTSSKVVILDVPIVVEDLYIHTDYLSTITQSAFHFQVNGIFRQESGEFIGSDAPITFAGHVDLLGGNFTASSGVTNFDLKKDHAVGVQLPTSNIEYIGRFNVDGGAFNANGGTSVFTRGFNSKSIEFYDLILNFVTSEFQGCCLIASPTITVRNHLDSVQGSLRSGIVEIYGTADLGEFSFRTNLESIHVLGNDTRTITFPARSYGGLLVDAPNVTIAGSGGSNLVFFSVRLFNAQDVNFGPRNVLAEASFESRTNVDMSTSQLSILGSYILDGGTFEAPSGLIRVGGSFLKQSGTFSHNGGTVELTDSSSVVSVPDRLVATNGIVFNHLAINKDTTSQSRIDLESFVDVLGNLTLSRGVVSGTGSGAEVRVAGNISRSDGYISAKHTRAISGNGSHVFHVGTGTQNAYTPVTIAQANGTGHVSVTSRTGTLSGALPVQSLTRNWLIEPTSGITQADLTLQYLQADVPLSASESAFKFVKRSSSVMTDFVPSSLNVSANVFTLNGAGLAGEWTLGAIDPTVPPSIVLDNGALAFGDVVVPNSSAPQTKAISGSDLVADIVCTAPAAFEVSTNGSTWQSSTTLTRTGNAVSGILHTRFTPTVAGTVSGNVTCSTPGVANVLFNVNGTGIGTPEIEIRGNNVIIANGDITPSLADHTSFGTVNVGNPMARTYRINNIGTDALQLTGVPRVVLTGPNAAEFSVQTQPSSPVAALGFTNFVVRFLPTSEGNKIATVTIANDDADENPYVFAIGGTAVGLPGVSFAKTALLSTDANGNGFADPGDIIGYQILVNSFGTAAATNVLVSDTLSGFTSLIPGSVIASPIAVPDLYSTTEGIRLDVVDGSTDLLSNDLNPHGSGTLAISASPTVSANGGIVSVDSATGAFTYDPPTGFVGLDTFNYTLSNGTGLFDTATVTIEVLSARSAKVERVVDHVSVRNAGSATDETIPTFEMLAGETVVKNLGTLPVGRSVRLIFLVMVEPGPYAPGMTHIPNTATGSADGLLETITNQTLIPLPMPTPTPTATETPTPTPTPEVLVSGRVTYATSTELRGVAGVIVTADGSALVETETDADGQYQMSGFGAGGYVLTPSKTGDVQGISAYDAALVSRHVVGTMALLPSQQVAADVSSNGSLSSFDAAQIARFAVSIPNSGSSGQWRFDPAARIFSEITGSMNAQDHLAFLMGDVSGDWEPETGTSERKESLTETPDNAIAVGIPDLVAGFGATVSVPIMTGDVTDRGVIAFQFDLHYDPTVVLPTTTPVVVADTISSQMSVAFNSSTPGRLRVAVYGTQPIVGSGRLLDLRFNVVGQSNSSTPLQLVNFFYNEREPLAVVTNGSMTVLAPTSAGVSVSGRVLTASGQGIRNARITVTGNTLSEPVTVTTGAFGHYNVEGLRSGETYVITVGSQRYTFAVPSRVVQLADSISGFDFVSQE